MSHSRLNVQISTSPDDADPMLAITSDEFLGKRKADCGCCYVVDLVALDVLIARVRGDR